MIDAAAGKVSARIPVGAAPLRWISRPMDAMPMSPPPARIRW